MAVDIRALDAEAEAILEKAKAQTAPLLPPMGGVIPPMRGGPAPSEAEVTLPYSLGAITRREPSVGGRFQVPMLGEGEVPSLQLEREAAKILMEANPPGREVGPIREDETTDEYKRRQAFARGDFFANIQPTPSASERDRKIRLGRLSPRDRSLFDLAETMAKEPKARLLGKLAAGAVAPEEREKFAEMYFDAVRRYKPHSKMSVPGKTAVAAFRGLEELPKWMQPHKLFLKEYDLDDDQELFARDLDAIGMGEDPLEGKDAGWVARGYYGAAEQAPLMGASLAAGGATAGVGKAAGLGNLGIRLAMSFGVGATYYETLRDDTYYELLKQGVDSKVAAKAAALSGILQGTAEGLIIPNPFRRFGGKELIGKTVRSVVGEQLLRFGTEAFVEEGIQNVTDESIKAITLELEGLAGPGPAEAVSTGLKNTWESVPAMMFLIGPGMLTSTTVDLMEIRDGLKKMRADGVSRKKGALIGLEGAAAKSQATRNAAVDEMISTLDRWMTKWDVSEKEVKDTLDRWMTKWDVSEKEVKDAQAVSGAETEVREEQGGKVVPGIGEEQGVEEQAGEGAEAQVQVEEVEKDRDRLRSDWTDALGEQIAEDEKRMWGDDALELQEAAVREEVEPGSRHPDTPDTQPESPWVSEARERVSQVPAFRGAKLEFDEEAGTVKATRPDGRTTTVHFNEDARLDALAKQRGKKVARGAYIYRTGKKGKFQEGHIYIRSDAGHDTLNHEVIHWLEDEGVITPEEVARYGGRETLASEYGRWIEGKSRKPNTVFQRIRDFLEPLLSSRRRFFEEIGKRGTDELGRPDVDTGEAGVSEGRVEPADAEGASPAPAAAEEVQPAGPPAPLAPAAVEPTAAESKPEGQQGRRIDVRKTPHGWSIAIADIPQELIDDEGFQEDYSPAKRRSPHGDRYFFRKDPTAAIEEWMAGEVSAAESAAAKGSVATRIGEMEPEQAEWYEAERARRIAILREATEYRNDNIEELLSGAGVSKNERGRFKAELARAAKEDDETKIPHFSEIKQYAREHPELGFDADSMFEILSQEALRMEAKVEAAVDKELAEYLARKTEAEPDIGEATEDDFDADMTFDTEALDEQIAEEEKKTALQKAAEKAEKEAADELDAFQKLLRRQGLMMNVHPEVLIGMAKLIQKQVKAKVLTYSAFLEKLAQQLGQAAVDRIEPMLRSEWNKLQQTGEIEGMQPAPEPEAPRPPKAPPKPPKKPPKSPPKKPPISGGITGTKNAITDALRREMGIDDRPEVDPESWEQWNEEAANIMQSNPLAATSLVQQLIDEPRDPGPVGHMILARHIRGLKNEMAAGENVRSELADAIVASEHAGTIWGQAGVSRKAEMAADYSFEKLVREHVKNVGEKPSEEQLAKYQEMAERIAELEAELAKAVEGKLQGEIDSLIDDAKKAPKKRKPRGKKKEELQKKAATAVGNFKEVWNELFGQVGAIQDPKRQGEKWAKLVRAAGRVIRTYAELGINNLAEIIAEVSRESGGLTEDQREAFKEAWVQEGMESPYGPNPQPEEIAKLAKDILKFIVESGITEREEVIDAVHEMLNTMGIKINRLDTMQAMSDYGVYRLLPTDAVSVRVRAIRGEIQQLLKLADMQAGVAPKLSGVERRTPSEEESQLIKEVNAAKKRGGYKVTDPKRQLKTAMDTAKTAVRNRIKALERAIANRERIVNERSSIEPDAELAALRKRRDELTKEYRAIFPVEKSPLTDAQRLKMAKGAIERQIKQVQSDLQQGNFVGKTRKPPLTDAELEAKKAELRALRQALNTARQADPAYLAAEEAKQNARYLKALERRLALWEDRLRDAEAGRIPAKKVSRTYEDPAIRAKQVEVARAKKAANAEILRVKREMRPGIQKVAEVFPELLNVSRAAMTAFDLSAVGRQGGVLGAAHPLLTRKAVGPMLKALASQEQHDAAVEMVRSMPTAELGQKVGLEITTEADALTAMEEAYMSRIARTYIPGIKQSERAYMTFLNIQRAVVFDHLVNKLGGVGAVTEGEARIIANWVNVATGRGELGSAKMAAATLATFFFAPRYVISRVQLALGQPMWTGMLQGQTDWRARRLIAAEYARAGLGLAAFYSSFLGMAALLWDDDDEDRPTVSFDSRSSDFGKLKFGETRVDPLAGMAQLTTLVSRIGTGQMVNSKGEVKAIRGEERKFTTPNAWKLMADFTRAKLSPSLATSVDWFTGETIVGDPVTTGSAALGMITPLVVEEVYEAYQDQGAARGTAISMMAIAGWGTQTYGEETRYKQANTEERAKLFDKYLDEMDWDAREPAYFSRLSKADKERFEQRKLQRQGRVLYRAFGPMPEDDKKHVTPLEERLAEYQQHQDVLRDFQAVEGPLTYDKAHRLLRDGYYRDPSRSAGTEFEGDSEGRLEAGYKERAHAIDAAFGKRRGAFFDWRESN